MLNIIKSLIFKPKLSQEALEAYWHKLPEKVEVGWFRDGKYIVGHINADGYEFMTQAFSATEFVEMVNDAIFAVYEIPREYFKVLGFRRFQPSKEEFAKLNNEIVKESQISFVKKLVVANC